MKKKFVSFIGVLILGTMVVGCGGGGSSSGGGSTNNVVTSLCLSQSFVSTGSFIETTTNTCDFAVNWASTIGAGIEAAGTLQPGESVRTRGDVVGCRPPAIGVISDFILTCT